MSRRERDEAALEAEIARLPDLGHDELAQALCCSGRPAPKSLRRKFMARALAYQMQVAAYGGLSAATKRRLREIAIAISNGDRAGVFSGVQIKPGTQLILQWQNTTHTVMVLDEGFALPCVGVIMIMRKNYFGWAGQGLLFPARNHRDGAGPRHWRQG